MKRFDRLLLICTVALALALWAGDASLAKKKKDKKAQNDPFETLVWPPPPDKARIKLDRIITGRADVTATSGFKQRLLRKNPLSAYDNLIKPFAVEFDPEGRILVTDLQTNGLIRFDLDNQKMDVIGSTGPQALRGPKGLHVSPDGRIFVADSMARRVVVYDPEGNVLRTYGEGRLQGPTDAALSPDGTRVWVADSHGHQVLAFDHESGELLLTIGKRGEAAGEFGNPTSLAFDADGNLYVVDQLNCRVQVFEGNGDYLDQFGSRGEGFGQFVRPKDIAIDEVGFIYVTDFQFGNVQIFDIDYALLTFVGTKGPDYGQFLGTSGVAVHGEQFAVVDQLTSRLQLFRYIVPKDE